MCLFLLAINCGFGAAELSTLRLREICLEGEGKGYIKRMRLKTAAGVYGEHWLYQHTVLALEWAVARARKIVETLRSEAFVIVPESGKRLVTKTKAGNRSNKAANAWQRLTERIRTDHPEFPALSFGKLRKTAGNLIKSVSNGETVAVFHQRSSAVKGDDEAEVYTDRLYQRVFKAQQEVCRQLQPMFDAVLDPFPDTQTKIYIGLKKIDAIKRMWTEGSKAEDIMVPTAVSRATAYRYKPAIPLNGPAHTISQPDPQQDGEPSPPPPFSISTAD
jgi:hypothetical protein